MDSYLDEREKWEALLRWLRTNGPAMLAGVALAALGYGGLRWWQGHVKSRDLTASVLYFRMERAFSRGDQMAGFVAAGKLERDFAATPYADQARLASAASFVQTGHLKRGASELAEVMTHPHDPILGMIARLRLARIQIALHEPQLALNTLDAVEPGAFAPRYDVVRGNAYYAMGKRRAALAQYRLARASDPGGETDSKLLGLEISELAANLPSPKSPANQASHRSAPAARPAASH